MNLQNHRGPVLLAGTTRPVTEEFAETHYLSLPHYSQISCSELKVHALPPPQIHIETLTTSVMGLGGGTLGSY